MNSTSTVKRVVLAFGLLVLAPLLLVGLVVGYYLLIEFLYGFGAEVLYVPGVALYVFAFCVPLGLYHWFRKSANQQSGTFHLPRVAWIAGGAVLATGLGQIILATHATAFYWLVFVAAAALPPLTALALAAQRLGAVTSWRRISASLLAGSLLAPAVALFLTGVVTILAYVLILPLREVVAVSFASQQLERLFYSPALVVMLVELAVVAPIVEEAAKPVGAILLARRLRSPAEAFLVGMAGGLGFAVVENMLYASSGATEWAHIVALRAVGGALHPLNAGLVGLGWYGLRNGLPGARRRLLSLYGLAVGIHALWNGGLGLLYSDLGAQLVGDRSWEISIYGIAQPGIVVVFMLLEAVALWRVLLVVTRDLSAGPVVAVGLTPGLQLERPGRLALWAAALFALIVPIAALYGPVVASYWRLAYPIG